jgi:hypothetical protein
MLAAVSLWDALDKTDVAAISNAGTTGEKPQSKVWEHDGDWWSVLADDSGTWLWRLDGDAWSPVVKLTNAGAAADVKVVGELAHVLLFEGSSSQFVTLEYGPNGYHFWDAQPNVIDISLGSGVETATIEVDSTGRLWVAYDRSSTVEVRYADGNYSSFSNPITVASGISSDDISSIIAMPGGTIGVFWSNQNTKRFGFRTHVDGTNPNTWTADEVPASQSAQSKGKGFADDHLHLAVSANGTLYAAVKTSYDTSGYASIALLVRRPNGSWDNVYTVDNSGTRPVVVISEEHNQFAVFYTENTGGGDIVMRASSLDNIDLGPVQVVLSGNFNDVTSSKANVGDEILVMAKKSGSAYATVIHVGDSGNAPNAAPLVNAGSDQSITLPNAANLSGAVSDDGKPTGTLTSTWTVVSGPGSVNFANANNATTSATFSAAGTYVLRLTANDGSLQTSDLVTIQVANAAPTNQAPTVNAGANQSIQLPGIANLSGTANDDGKPSGTLSTVWTKISGPGSVAFANANSVNTTAAFSQAGTYVLRLTANDGSLQASDDLTILVEDDLSADPHSGDADPSLVGHWSLNNNGADQSGHGNNGTLAGTASYVAGKYDQALNVSSNGRLNVADNSSLDVTGPVTLSAWIRPSSKATQYFVSKGEKGVSDGFELSLSNSGTIFVRFNEKSSGDSYRVDSTSKYSTNGTTWIHVTATYDGSTIRLYINGQLQGSKNASFQIGANNNSLSIGSGANGYRGMKGAVDDVRLYSRALSANEVTALMNNTPSGPQNAAPSVNAGIDKTITLPGNVSLTGSASDDNLPSGTLTTLWAKVSGPGTVNFANAGATTTTATFSQAGTYVLRLTANDGSLQASDDVTVQVNAQAQQNVAPTVNAGTDKAITLPGNVSLTGSASDDNLPSGTLTTTWTKISGPGTVNFANAGATSTTATFSQAGTYVLRLTANDGSLQASDDVTVQVNAQAPQNTAPSVNAGTDKTITLPGNVSLTGSASDDNLPSNTLTTTWTKISGPGTVSFANAGATSTTATFSQAGTYVLRLTANDGSLQASDDVTVQVNAAPTQGNNEGLVGHWTMDGNGNDASGNGNNGAPIGSTSYGAGRVSSALLLASSSSRLQVPDSNSLDITGPITIAAWIRPSSAGTQYVVSKNVKAATDGFELSLSNAGKVFVRFNEDSSGDSLRVDSTSKYPTNGSTWMHVVATYDGTTIKLYVNGQLEGSKAANFQIAANDVPLSIGSGDGGYRGMKGAVDDVRIYSRALSAAEVTALAQL